MTKTYCESRYIKYPMYSLKWNECGVMLEKKFKNVPCVYFLYDVTYSDKNCVYVGRSINIYGRISIHKHDKKWDKMRFIVLFDKVQMCRLERYYIKELKPKYNCESHKKCV